MVLSMSLNKVSLPYLGHVSGQSCQPWVVTGPRFKLLANGAFLLRVNQCVQPLLHAESHEGDWDDVQHCPVTTPLSSL